MKKILIGDKYYDLQIEFRKRKTLEIRIIPPGEIKIISPAGVSNREIERILKKKEKWLLEKFEQAKETSLSNKKYIDGEEFYYLGKIIHLKIKEHNRDFVEFNDNKIFVYTDDGSKNNIEGLLANWYGRQTMEMVKQDVNKYTKLLQVHPKCVRVKNQKTILGSCSSKKNLNFNLRLSMMPRRVIEYIVVHEMCHLIHMNHSKEYWGQVESVLPDYKEQKSWIKDHVKPIMNTFNTF